MISLKADTRVFARHFRRAWQALKAFAKALQIIPPKSNGLPVCKHEMIGNIMGKPFDGRYEWLNDNPEVIGGRDVGLSQLFLSLQLAVKEGYVINAVPEEIVRALRKCEVSCRDAENQLKALIEKVSDSLDPETSLHRYWPKTTDTGA